MSENIQSISLGTYTIGNTNELTFSAGPGIKIDQPSEGVVRIGNDETVLWSGLLWDGQTTTAQLSEAASNFQYVRVYGVAHEATGRQCTQIIQSSGENDVSFQSGPVWYTSKVTFIADNTNLALNSHYNYWLNGTTMNAGADGVMIKKIVGINRKEV